MKKSIKTTITVAIAATALAGMYTAYTTNGNSNFTDFVGNLFRKEGETVEEAKKRLQGASAHE